MTLETKIAEIEKIITDSKKVDNWGGWCINMTDKEIPYGVKPLENKTVANSYTINDTKKVTGYLYVKDVVSSSRVGLFDVIIGINLFINPRKTGKLTACYEVPFYLIGLLKKPFKDIRIVSNANQRYAFHEMTQIEVTIKDYSGCELTLNNPIC